MSVLWHLLLLTFLWQPTRLLAAAGKFPTRKNILLVLDVPLNNENIDSISQILDGISLMKYRISAVSTNGFSQDVFHYQSRQCLVDKLKTFTENHHHHTLSQVLAKATKKFYKDFPSHEKIVVVVSHRLMSQNTQSILLDFFHRLSTYGIYNLVVNKNNNKDEFRSTNNAYSLVKLTKNHETPVNKQFQSLDDLLKQLEFYQGNLKICQSSKQYMIVYDECNRECQCVDGRLRNCYRVRRQFSSLPSRERQYYLDAYKELAAGKTFARRYREYMKVHVKYFKILHSAPLLLTWHRRFVYETENLLRLLDCRITIPYWNFPLYENTTYKSTPSHRFWDDIGGMGSTRTNISNGYCVETGQFSRAQWKTPKVPDWYFQEFIYSVCYDHFYSIENDDTRTADKCAMTFRETFPQKCVTRNPGCLIKLPTYKRIYDVIKTLTADRFEEFEKIFRTQWHIVLHNCLGGNMGSAVSIYAPEFWPFHSMVDALWTYWQNKGVEYKRVLMTDRVTTLLGFDEKRWLHQDNDNVGGCGVKIKYTQIFPHTP